MQVGRDPCLYSAQPVQPYCPLLQYLPDVSAIDDIQVLGQTEVSIQVDWKNPPADVDYFRLMHTDSAGQEEELNVQRSQEMRTKHTIVGECCNRLTFASRHEMEMHEEQYLIFFSHIIISQNVMIADNIHLWPQCRMDDQDCCI